MLNFYSYRLPFKTPFRSAGNSHSHREGIILVFKDGTTEAYGEVAPLPGFSTETLEQVTEVLKLNHKQLEEALEAGEVSALLQVIDQIHHFPSLSFGIDTLIHDLEAKKKGQSLGNYLFDNFPKSITANATLPLQETTKTIANAKSLIKEGFQTLKIKVGENFNAELNLIQDLRNQFPDIKIRIDANQAWTKPEAIQHLKALHSLNIEYCEQPVPKDQIEELTDVTNQADISIAADESIRNKEQAIKLSEQKAANLFILKPMLLGTFRNIFVTNGVSTTHNIESIYTTSLETAVGRTATAILAAGLGRQHRAQGIATGHLFQHDVSNSEWLNKPVIHFPQEPGLGIELSFEGLKKVS
jgi:o-succinylbenzoate synthase